MNPAHRRVRLSCVRLSFTVIVSTILAVALPFFLPARAAGVVGNGTPGSCTESALLVALAGGGQVTFNCGAAPVVISIVDHGEISLSGSTSVDGGGLVTIERTTTLSRLFHLQADSTLTLTNVTLRNGSSYPWEGGCILVDAGGFLYLYNTVISNCSAMYGGGIYAYGTVGVHYSTFSGNVATWASDLYVSGTLTVSHSTLSSSGGQALYVFGSASLNDSVLRSDIYLSGTATVHSSIFDRAQINNYGSTAIVDCTFVGLITNQGVLTVTDTNFVGDSLNAGHSGIINWGTATFISVTITGYKNDGTGGGGIANYGTLSLTNTTLSDNTAYSGGGLWNGYGTATIVNSTIRGNRATYGGGISTGTPLTLIDTSVTDNTASDFGGGIFNQSMTTLKNTRVSNNAAGYSGGIYNSGGVDLKNSWLNGNAANLGGGLGIDFSGVATFTNSLVSSNSARVGGGVLIGNYGTLRMHASALHGNRASDDGGGLALGGTAIMENSTLSGNSAGGNGGGIYFWINGQARMLNVTVSNNASPVGGGLFISSTAQVAMTNTIVAYNWTGGNCFGSVSFSTHSISSDGTCALAGTGDQNNTDPQLTALGNYGGLTQVHMPRAGSPAIDAGTAGGAPTTDQRGYARPITITVGGFDIGAVERQPGDSDLAPRLYLPALLQ